MPDEEDALEEIRPRITSSISKPTRTTFSFSERGIEALAWLSDRHDPSTHRKVFDGLAFLAGVFGGAKKEAQSSFMDALPSVEGGERRRRTYVIGHEDLKALSRFADNCGLTRDEAIERLLLFSQFYEQTLMKERRVNQQRVIDLWDEIVGKAIDRFWQEAKDICDGDDPVTHEFSQATMDIDDRRDEASSLIESDEGEN